MSPASGAVPSELRDRPVVTPVHRARGSRIMYRRDERPDRVDPRSDYRWWLVAANSRALAHSVSTYASVDLCRIALDLVCRQAPPVVSPIVRSQLKHTWRWIVTVDDIPIATSAVEYSRRAPCERAYSQFWVELQGRSA
jgi:uncharacterized protein YegP (UPF0339 family)